MIYETPAFRPGGDRYMLIEFGNEMNLELNFMAQGLATAIAEQKTKGVIETAPCFASMLIHYEPDEISYADLSRELERLIAALGPSDDIELESRIFYFPTVYLDPWTRECVQDYIAKIAPKQTDPEFVAELNGLSDVDQFVRVHSGTEYWVASLGFWPGLPFMMALDPRCKLTAPKYNPPRTWTPKGTVGMGGASTAIYPEHLPGGYQIFGRIPVPIWDPEKRFDVFADSICLFRPGDRVKFVPCTVEEFEEAERRVADGSYVYNLVEYQKFSVRQYKRWVGSLDLARRF
ncbi:allophanate hydrolase subunit 1 [Inquilinus sp. Marseille-Q2685]|uniref:5-oxoprolinase subunit B family protein n=1 Tax=Inquilinus sp. Marseille-Q2685 TaxID=2866581 RepID=UPI001CE4B5E8|nr:carboxyltransferase domain-containing protein [Inquilinus sp. Marseille-Q2685]